MGSFSAPRRATEGVRGEGQNRTADTAIFSRVLCQLSYLARGRQDSNGRELPDRKTASMGTGTIRGVC
jgi:hypothetical protein